MKGLLFTPGVLSQIEVRLQEDFSVSPEKLSANTARSPRAAADAIETRIVARFPDICGFDCHQFSAAPSRRSVQDFSFNDAEGYKYLIDVKTHRSDTSFSMPNLISVERLFELYEDPEVFLVLLLVRYEVQAEIIRCHQVTMFPIEFLDLSCLTFGNLGKGQIQIKNSNKVLLNPGLSRREWMIQLCDRLLEFYPAEKLKLDKRIAKAERERQRWQALDP